MKLKQASIYLISFIFLLVTLYAYEGEEEVEEMFSKIIDISNPTFDEYLMIQNFLRYGKRPYLGILDGFDATNHKELLKGHRYLKLVGDNNEMPLFEIYHVGACPYNGRCIVLYSSYNIPYPDKARKLIDELQQAGYQGDILLRIGGYPNMREEGIKLCHIPYSWKVAMIKEAQLLGYDSVMWLDTSMHPLTNLSTIFSIIEDEGHFFITGVTLGFEYNQMHCCHEKKALTALRVTDEELNAIPHIWSCVLGFSTKNTQAVKTLNDWLEETKKVESSITPYPEEPTLSVCAWKNNLKTKPCDWFVCHEAIYENLKSSQNCHFIFDTKR